MTDLRSSLFERSESLKLDVETFLKREIEIGSFPGASWAVGGPDGEILEGALGNAVVKPARIHATSETRYDVASLTKPIVTATLALLTHARGKADLDEPIGRWVPELHEDKSGLTLTDLLTHRGGFQAWYPLYVVGYGTERYLEALVTRPLRYLPGTSEIYSCLGYVLAKITLERIWGEPLEETARRELFQPLELPFATFNPRPRDKYVIAATEWGNFNERRMVAARNLSYKDFRNYMIWGEVNDNNAWHLGGFGGNAGLFATAAEVLKLTGIYLAGPLLPPELRERALVNHTTGDEENRGLGWQLKMEKEGHPSGAFGERTFGHTGFTGTSVWSDPDHGLSFVLLTNRLHPNVQTVDMQRIRRRFHDLFVSGPGSSKD